MLHRGGKNHDALPVAALGYDVGDDVSRRAPVTDISAVDIGGIKLATAIQFHVERVITLGVDCA